MSDSRPRVLLVGTGGTISYAGRDSLDLWEYMDHGRRMPVPEILSLFPEVEAAATIIPVDVRQVSSSGITPDDWLTLVDAVHRSVAANPDVDGVVITHGTATLEETAYFLSLALKVDLPVVVIGAQRPSSGFATDAGSNLLCALRVASAPQARGLGVLVVLNEEIHAAREVTKTSTLRLETFRAPDIGMLGYADPDGTVAIYRRPVRPCCRDTEFDVAGIGTLPRVDIALSYAGADDAAISGFVNAGARAIVCATLAPGLPTPAQEQALGAAIARGIPVIYSSRAGSGRVLRRGSMRQAGIVAADSLNPQKARVLAMLALTRTSEPDEIQRMFDTY